MSTVNKTDHELMVAVAHGELSGMSEIYDRRHKALFRFFFRLTGRQTTAEDLTHEVFLRMIRYRHTYQSGDGLEAWMHRLARNPFADQAKKHRLEIAPSAADAEVIDRAAPSPFETAAREQETAILYKAL